MRSSGILSMICLSLCSCGNSSGGGFSTERPTDITESNEIRQTLGLREIKQHWHFYGRQFDEEKWSDQNRDLQKVVKRSQDNTILWEYDYYHSGATYVSKSGDGVDFEQLIIHYDYTDDSLYLAYIGVDKRILKIINGM